MDGASQGTPNLHGSEEHPISKRSRIKETANLSNHSEANFLWIAVFENRYLKDFFKGKKPEEIIKIKRRLVHIYAKVEDLFGEFERSSGDPYFYHILETTFILLEESYGGEWYIKPDISDVYLALLHDIIEDTHKSFSGLIENFGSEVAFGIHLISKKPFHTCFIDDLSLMHEYIGLVDIIGKDNLNLDESIRDEKKVDKKVVKAYNEMRDTYRSIRNEEHFKDYWSFTTFYKHAIKEAESLGVRINHEEIGNICYRILQVKLCDRLHNLRTMNHLKTETIERKIDETEKYFINLANEINPTMAEKIQIEIQNLRSIIAERKTSSTISSSKDKAESIQRSKK